ncbi:MAG: TIGR04211 family SH3 domain-containing protein [Gammaproteobacteria bacterium]|nr:TIGR04211 family SH3 domain-containing protein [Gammaproteobacteria bacterium]MCI0591245.1 TIGR04211 family SH3 domain-containing protein [Gammaproteobacteria bacterium]
MRNSFLRMLGTLVLVIMPQAITAETVYVIDKLLVGVHENKTLESPIIKVLPTGTALEVLKREGELVYVRDAEGVKGWVDAGYLMNEMPAGQMLEKLETRNKQLEAEFATAQRQLSELELKFAEFQRSTAETAAGGSTRNMRLLQQENDQLKHQYAAEHAKADHLQKQLLELTNRLQSTGGNQALAKELQRIQQENERLAEQLAGRQTSGEINLRSGTATDWYRVRFTWRGAILILAVSLVIGFIAGAYLIDYIHRRRHGGFRI